jgi:hypothetical protein
LKVTAPGSSPKCCPWRLTTAPRGAASAGKKELTLGSGGGVGDGGWVGVGAAAGPQAALASKMLVSKKANATSSRSLFILSPSQLY